MGRYHFFLSEGIFFFLKQDSSQEGGVPAVKPAAAKDIFLQVFLHSFPSRCFQGVLPSLYGLEGPLSGWAACTVLQEHGAPESERFITAKVGFLLMLPIH